MFSLLAIIFSPLPSLFPFFMYLLFFLLSLFSRSPCVSPFLASRPSYFFYSFSVSPQSTFPRFSLPLSALLSFLSLYSHPAFVVSVCHSLFTLSSGFSLRLLLFFVSCICCSLLSLFVLCLLLCLPIIIDAHLPFIVHLLFWYPSFPFSPVSIVIFICPVFHSLSRANATENSTEATRSYYPYL